MGTKIILGIIIIVIVSCTTNYGWRENQLDNQLDELSKNEGLHLSQNVEKIDPTGKWIRVSNENYVIKLSKEDMSNTVIGNHCFVSDNGMKIDCEYEGISLKGIIKKRKIVGKVKSSFEVDSLRFEINFTSDSIFTFYLKDEIGSSMFLDTMTFKRMK